MTTIQKIIILVCTAMLALSSAFLIGMEEKKGIKRKNENTGITTRARTAATRETRTEMTAAITTNKPEVLAQLIAKHPDFDIDMKNRIDGDTLLMQAAQHGRMKCAHILLDAGADINAQNSSNDTALHLAAIWEHEELLALLVRAGADVSLTNNFECTPLHYVADHENAEGTQLLIEYGANPDAQDDDANTPFHNAVANDDVATVKILFAGGATMELINGDGKTVLDIALDNARKRNKSKCIKFFSPFRQRKLV